MRNESLIEVWIDPKNPGEPFFCVGGMIDLHMRSGTVGNTAVLIGAYHTNSMQEAQRLFLQEMKDAGDKAAFDEMLGGEGWD